MFSIDIKVNGKTLYAIQGKNLTPRGIDYAGICAYELEIKGQKFSVFHERRDGLLRLVSKVIARLSREVRSGNIKRKEIEEK
jgi:hypothetical protein